jgi:glycerol-3-phosphate acyltransferase PlsX
MKIIIDAMGGDYAPNVVIEGSVAAVKEYGVDIILTGDEARIKDLLAKRHYTGDKIAIHHTTEVIEMSEPAAVSVRKKKNSSISVGLSLLKENGAGAFFSAGNTGAVVCAATLTLGLLPGVERPGIAIVYPTLKEITLMVDVGANIDAKPIHILQYAAMADAYSRSVLNKVKPTIGLLNIGEEATKGTDFVKETYNLLSQSSINFVGNVEGKDLFTGKCDIVLCDGFVGNIALKVSEGVATLIYGLLKREFTATFMSTMAAFLLRSNLKRLRKSMDYSEYGGAPLLGVNGIVIIGHGRSSAKAIKNAIRTAKEQVERNVNAGMVENLSKLKLPSRQT